MRVCNSIEEGMYVMFKSVMGLIAVVCFLTFSLMFNCYSLAVSPEISTTGLSGICILKMYEKKGYR